MKKTLVALAAFAAVSAFAQATLSGVVRFGYQKAPNATALVKGDTGFALTDATFNLGLAEDLGGGLKAAANVTFDQNSSAFGNALNRRNTSLALTGGFGRIGFAQTRSSDLLTQGMVAPSNLPEGLYNTSAIVARGNIDTFGYGIALGPVSASLTLVESAADGTVSPTRFTTVIGLGYANGPLAASFAYKNTAAKNGAILPAGFVKGNTEFAATYDLGVAKVGFGYDSKMNALSPAPVHVADAAKSAISMGVSVPFGPATVGLNYAKRGSAKVTEVAANYALSKRTSVNASFGNQSAGNVALRKQSQYRISMAHSF